MRCAATVKLMGLALTGILLNAHVHALSNGMSGVSAGGCGGGCHANGPAGTFIQVTGPTIVAPGSASAYTVSVPVGARGGGLDVTVSAGTLAAGAGTQLVGADITHASSSARTWTYTWTAPLTNGPQQMQVAALESNENGDPDGDGWDLATLALTVTGTPPADADGDGTPDATDCAPADPAVHPGAAENCVNGIDDDCDGAADALDTTCGGVPDVAMLGDVAPRGALDGLIDIGDVVLALRFSVGLDVMTPAERIAADVAPGRVTLASSQPPVFTADPNGAVDVGDVVVLLRAAVGLIQIDPPLPFQGENNLISFHANAWLQDANECLRCHGTMTNEPHSTAATPAFHPRHLPLLPSYSCISCHESVDLLEKSGASLRRQVHVEICAGCHATGRPGALAGYRLYLR